MWGISLGMPNAPDSGIAARYKRLGISVRQGQKIKAYLASAGLIEEEETRTATGKTLIIRLTEKGQSVLSVLRHGKAYVAQ